MRLYKVLKRVEGELVGPYQNDYKYKPGIEYICSNFDSNREHTCSMGYHATDIEGLIYSFRSLPEYETWEVEVGGMSVELDSFKRRYERIKLIRPLSAEELKEKALSIEDEVGYRLSEALFPTNPLELNTTHITEKDLELLRGWSFVCGNIWSYEEDYRLPDGVESLVWNCVWGSVGKGIMDSIKISVDKQIKNLMMSNTPYESIIWYKVWSQLVELVWAYVFGLFSEPIDWGHSIAGSQLWYRGLVPICIHEVWSLYAGKDANILWKDTKRRFTKKSPGKYARLLKKIDRAIIKGQDL